MVRARVKPEMIRWVRLDAGLSRSDVARKTGTTESIVREWEHGDRQATVRQLRLLGKAARRPLAIFYLPEPPRTFAALKDFRQLSGMSAADPSPALRLAVRSALERRQVALDLAKQLGEVPPPLPISASCDELVTDVARRIRAFLAISHDEQRRWRGKYDALNAWRSAIQERGVMVFQTPGVEIDEMRGFSVAEPPMPVIVLNIKDAPNGRVFTLLHEFCHLLLRAGGICDLHDPTGPPEHNPAEAFCNSVAGETLVPATELAKSRTVQEHEIGKKWTTIELDVLAREFSVSREVVLRRLLITKHITPVGYEEHRKSYYEISSPRPRNKSGGPPPSVLASAYLGRTFIRLVLVSCYQQVITTSDVSKHLGVRMKHLSKIERDVIGTPVLFD